MPPSLVEARNWPCGSVLMESSWRLRRLGEHDDNLNVPQAIKVCAHARPAALPSRTPASPPSTGTVEGRIFWNEQPVAGAHVYATSEYNFSSTHYGDATTDGEGRFSILGVPAGQKYLYAFGTGRPFWVAAVTPFVMIAGQGTVASDTYLC